MKITELTKNNILIAEFMGFVLTDKVTLPNEYKGEDSHFSILEFIDIIRESENLPPTSLQNLKFNSDWNWLMAVVEKIEKVSHVTEFTIFGDSRGYYQCTIRQYTDSGRKERVNIECDSKIEAVYIACVEFIKWYNKNK